MMQTSSFAADWIGHAGAVLVALPGGGCSPHVFDAVQLPGIAMQAIDWAGAPGPRDPQSVADRLSLAIAQRAAPTALVGHSAGAAVAALVAANARAPLSALILTNTGVHSRAHGDPTLPQRVREGWDAAAQQAFLRSCFDRLPEPGLWRLLCDYLAQLPAAVFLEVIEGLRGTDLSEALPRISVPTLIVHGEFDHRRRVADAQQLAQAIPGASLVLVPGGHTPMVDCPEHYSQAIRSFLENVPGLHGFETRPFNEEKQP